MNNPHIAFITDSAPAVKLKITNGDN